MLCALQLRGRVLCLTDECAISTDGNHLPNMREGVSDPHPGVPGCGAHSPD